MEGHAHRLAGALSNLSYISYILLDPRLSSELSKVGQFSFKFAGNTFRTLHPSLVFILGGNVAVLIARLTMFSLSLCFQDVV